MKKIIAGVMLALLTSACGWQLRGTADIPQNLSHLYIETSEEKSPLVTELRKSLTANHIGLTDDSQNANYILTLREEKRDKRTVGVGSDALSSAYELSLKADYEIRGKNNPLPAKATAISIRNFNYNTASISSATQEEALLITEMRRDLVQQMLRRLNAVVTHPQTPSANKSE
ncbi:MAG TPA: LPS assembly lipoprotein LptE [Cellvibrio sp.]|nr:LPS assembly lipoprotein LptE [Cellvibrio sp.]